PITLEPLIIDGQAQASVSDAVVALGLRPVPDGRHTLFLGTVRPRTFDIGAAGDRVGSAYACKHWGIIGQFFAFAVYLLEFLGCGRFSQDRKSTRLNSSHVSISYAVFC